MSKFQIKSIFEQISSQVFPMTNLGEVKTFIREFVEGKEIKEEDKLGILREVESATSLIKLQTYICNSLLKFEGHGLAQLNPKKD